MSHRRSSNSSFFAPLSASAGHRAHAGGGAPGGHSRDNLPSRPTPLSRALPPRGRAPAQPGWNSQYGLLDELMDGMEVQELSSQTVFDRFFGSSPASAPGSAAGTAPASGPATGAQAAPRALKDPSRKG